METMTLHFLFLVQCQKGNRNWHRCLVLDATKKTILICISIFNIICLLCMTHPKDEYHFNSFFFNFNVYFLQKIIFDLNFWNSHSKPLTVAIQHGIKLKIATDMSVNYSSVSGLPLLSTSISSCFDVFSSWMQEVRQGGGYLLVATDIAARGVDLPEITHIYNFDLPRTAVDYLHRAGRTGRKPFSDEKCNVTSIMMPEERFVLQRYENELMFNCEELFL